LAKLRDLNPRAVALPVFGVAQEPLSAMKVDVEPGADEAGPAVAGASSWSRTGSDRSIHCFTLTLRRERRLTRPVHL